MDSSPSTRIMDAWANLRPLAAFADGPVAHHSQPVAAERVVSGAEPDRDDPHMVSHG